MARSPTSRSTTCSTSTSAVITADHSHTSQIVPANQDTPGFYATLQSADGVPIRVSYGTGKTRVADPHRRPGAGRGDD